MDKDLQLQRTLSIVRQLAQGKTLPLPDGHRIAMGEDFSIGYLLEKSDGTCFVGGLSTMDLKELNETLEYHGIGFALEGR